MEFFNLKQPHGANKYPQYTAVYSKYTAVYSKVYGRILRYWSLEHTAVYPMTPKWGSFKHNIDHHNWQTRGIPQPTYACIVHYTFVPTLHATYPFLPKPPFLPVYSEVFLVCQVMLTIKAVRQSLYMIICGVKNVRYDKKFAILVHLGYGPQKVQKWAEKTSNLHCSTHSCAQSIIFHLLPSIQILIIPSYASNMCVDGDR